MKRIYDKKETLWEMIEKDKLFFILMVAVAVLIWTLLFVRIFVFV